MARGCFFFIGLLALLLVVSCAENEVNTRALHLGDFSADLQGSPDLNILSLSHSPYEVVADSVETVFLQRDLRIGQDEPWFGRATDVAGLADGQFAVFDNMQRHIVVIDSIGRVQARYGREGGGPGEYRFPLALEAVGNGLVAWDSNSASAFTVLDSAGKVVSVGTRGAEGDWDNASFRGPRIDADDLQQGPEDVTRRLSPFGEEGFVYALGQNEFEHEIEEIEAPFSWDAPPVHLILYGMDAQIRDTLATMAGPPLVLRQERPGLTNQYAEPLYSARPIWTTGDGWLALGHGDSSHVVVREFSGDTILVIEWPERRYDVLDSEKISGAKWIAAFTALNSEYSREFIEQASAATKQRELEKDAFERRAIADRAPYLTAAYGAGSCLYLAGFSADDWVDGTSLTWMVLDVRRGELVSIFRIPRPADQNLTFERNGAAVRDFDEKFVYVVFRDENGAFLVERYQLPHSSCGGQRESS